MTPTAEPRAGAIASWLVLDGPLAARLRLEPDVPAVLGRTLQATVPVPDGCVSRRHCKFTLTPKGVVLTDLESANGTYLNGRRVRQALVSPGDVLELGEVRARLALEGAPLPRGVPCGDCGALTVAPVEPGVAPLEEAPRCARCLEADAGRAFPGLATVRRLASEGYLVVECLARAGLVAVYAARRARLDQVVALKVLSLDGPVTRTQLQRFLEGAQAHARLRHPHVAAIHDVRHTPHLAYVVMERVEGETLAARLAREGPLSVRLALRLAHHLAQALDHLRERRVVHRDLKPANVMLTPAGDARLIDFGVARQITDDEPGGAAETLGTPGYMAPEQRRTARFVDHRADLFGLGATLYHALTGAPPPADPLGPGGLESLDLPRPVTDLIARLLAPDREARLPSPAATLVAIGRVVEALAGVRAAPGEVELLLLREDSSGLPTPPTAAARPPLPAAAIEGLLEGTALLEVLQLLELHRKEGVLEVDGDRRGTLHVRAGRVVAAEVRGAAPQRGRPALRALLDAAGGRFRFVAQEIPPGPCDLAISAEVLDWLRSSEGGETARDPR